MFDQPMSDHIMAERHTGIGIASFVISLLSGILMLALFVIAGMLETSTPGGLDEESPTAMIVGLSMMVLLTFDLLALGLGIGDLVQKNNKKVFATLGIVLSSVVILGTILLVIVGLAIG